MQQKASTNNIFVANPRVFINGSIRIRSFVVTFVCMFVPKEKSWPQQRLYLCWLGWMVWFDSVCATDKSPFLCKAKGTNTTGKGEAPAIKEHSEVGSENESIRFYIYQRLTLSTTTKLRFPERKESSRPHDSGTVSMYACMHAWRLKDLFS